MSAEDKQALPPGFRLGAYHVVQVLGVGGFGVTYLCEHTGLAVQVAVKEYLPNEIAVRDGTEVHPKSAGDREGFEWGLSRFLDEARTLARFEHPNVVRVRDCFEANNTAYIVMDYEDGEPLDVLLRRHGTLTEAQLNRVLLPVVDGLRQVHAAGFLHRDIKPANIFVRRSDESPVLLDFGSARQALGRKSKSVTAIASAGYSPPEQYESDGEQGPWTDIYALSALCYRAITGEAPMEATRRQNQLLRSQTDPLPSLAESAAAGYSPAFLEAVDVGLRLIERDRPQSLDQWLAVLDSSAAADAPAAASRQEEREADRPCARTRWPALAGAAAVAIGLALYIFYGPRAPEPDQAPPPAPEQLATQSPSVDGADETSTESEAQAAARAVPDERTTSSSPKDWLQLRAEQGDAEAQYNLGRMYDTGKGIPMDAVKAAFWFRKAAEQQHADAQHSLGLMYEYGLGVPENDIQAVFWYRKAAEQGHAEAQHFLGHMYDDGEGVPVDDVQAVSWYRKAAEQGYAGAQYTLGVKYALGKGVPMDGVQAVSWYRKAAEQGYARAQYTLGSTYDDGYRVPEDDVQAVSWYRKAAEQGYARAQYRLGVMYFNGEGVPADDIQAYAWVNLAAAQGMERAEQAKATLQKEMTTAQIADAQALSRELAD